MDSLFDRLLDARLAQMMEQSMLVQANTELSKKLGETHTNLDRINLVYTYKLENNNIAPFCKDEKNEDLSKKILDKGTAIYHDVRYMESLDVYTIALMLAETTARKANAYANRSAALFQLGLYRECVTDCNRALEHGYPEALRGKLLGRIERATKKIPQQTFKFHDDIPVIPENKKNATISCASNSIKMDSNEKYGRYIVATRDIEIGEVILVEKPYACILYDEVTNHCDHCLELCYNLIPCDDCISVGFCSEDCKMKAKELYHEYECKITLTLLHLEVPRMRLVGLRILFRGFREVLKAKEEQKSVDHNIYRSDRMKEILELMPDIDSLPIDELMRVCSSVSEMYHLVKNHTDFLRTSEEHDKFKDLLLTVYSLARLNGVGVPEVFEGQPRSFATALYPALSLFNHSCCPNVYRVAYGQTIVLRAQKTIKRGEQCFITYGPSIAEPRSARQETLQTRYHFKCTCKACERNWSMDFGSSRTNRAKMMELLEYIQAGRRLCDNLDVTAAENMLKQIKSRLLKTERLEPCFEYLSLLQCFQMCVNIMGNRRKY